MTKFQRNGSEVWDDGGDGSRNGSQPNLEIWQHWNWGTLKEADCGLTLKYLTFLICLLATSRLHQDGNRGAPFLHSRILLWGR